MAWPTPQDYNEALQSPRLNFDDADLKAGTPDVTVLGLPRPITGGFASVYSVRSNSKRWAVRCFLRDFADHRERYGAIARHLAAANLPYTVHFQFLEKGIRVRGQWYPLLKMEWIEGSTFQEAIEANVQNPEALASLAERWVKMLGALNKHGIAHGDLQHGNVLIAGGEFRLIDYDGMFVPSLSGRASHEVGHRNYQHPARVEADFGPHLDNFSAWVIFFTLMAISVDPSLWGRFGNNQEHLLFQREDFEQPRYSRVFRSLRNLNDDRIRRYLPLFESFLAMRLLSINSPADVIRTRLKKRTSWQTSLPNWFSHQLEMFTPEPKPPAPLTIPDIPLKVSEPAPIAVAPAATAAPAEREPVIDPPSVVDAVTFLQPVVMERVFLVSYAAFFAVLVFLAARGVMRGMATAPVVLAGFLCSTVCLLCSYVLSDEVRSKLVLRLRIEFRRGKCRAIQYAVERMDVGLAWLHLKESAKLERLADRDTEHVRHKKERLAGLVQALEARQQKSIARAWARFQILRVRRKRDRQRERFVLKCANTRRRFESPRQYLQGIRDRSNALGDITRIELADGRREMDRYRGIRFSKYVLRVFGFL